METIQFELIFQPERLSKLAAYLVVINTRQKIEILEDEDGILDANGVAKNIVPVFSNMIEALPSVFPGEWKKRRQGEYYWNAHKKLSCLTSLMGFFGLESDKLLLHLFVPYAQAQNYYGGQVLTNHARTTNMAENIYELLLLKRNAMELHPDIKIFVSKN
jgi:hypothetical protein